MMKRLWLVLATCLLFLNLIWIYHTYQYDAYTQAVGEITTIQVLSQTNTKDEHHNTDQLTTQKLEVLLKQSKYQHKTITISNTYSQSLIEDQQYKAGDIVFLSIPNQDINQASIIDSKRDTTLALLSLILLLFLIVIGHKNGTMTIIGLMFNTIIFYIVIFIYDILGHNSLIWLTMLFSPIIISLTLILANGWHKKTRIAILSTYCSTLITFLIGLGVITITKHRGLHYEQMELITRPQHMLFLTSLLIGSIGATMDIAITLSSSLGEIISYEPEKTKAQLYQSGLKVGSDVVGPMVNIMFFSYLSGSIPMTLIFLRNDMSFNFTFPVSLSLEVTRALVGSIGIVLSIPITSYLASYFFTKEVSYER